MNLDYCKYLKSVGLWCDDRLCHYCKEANCKDRLQDSYLLDDKCTPFKRITVREKRRYGVCAE